MKRWLWCALSISWGGVAVQAQPVKDTFVHQSMGIEYARVFFSRGDLWGNALRIQHDAGFGKRQIIGVQTSFGMLQKQRGSSSALAESGLQAAYYSADIGLKLNLGLGPIKLSAMGGYAFLWGNQIEPGQAVGIYRPGNAAFYLVEPRQNQSAVFTNIVYDGLTYQLQLTVPVGNQFSMALTGRTLVVYTREQRDQYFTARINNMVASAGLSVHYSFRQ